MTMPLPLPLTAPAPAPKVTTLNLSALRELFAGANDGAGLLREASNQLRATSVPHIRRCLKAGLVEVASRTTLRLTDAGVAALSR